MYTYEYIQQNQSVMKELVLEIRQRPLSLTFRGENVYDKKTGKLISVNLVDIVEKDESGIWKPIFEFEGERKSQACSIIRKFLERGRSESYPNGFPAEYWDTKAKKGKNLRGFPVLTAKIDNAIIEAKVIIPPYMRRKGNPQKPSTKGKNKKSPAKATSKQNSDEESDEEENEEEPTHERRKSSIKIKEEVDEEEDYEDEEEELSFLVNKYL
jgi:hypothetical protein